MVFSFGCNAETQGAFKNNHHHTTKARETSLVVQWLRLCSPNSGGPGSIPGQGIRSYMLQLKIQHAAMKIEDLHAELRPDTAK